MPETRLDRFGVTAVASVIFHFYDEVLRSPRLCRYFAGVDRERLIANQTNFLSAVLGGRTHSRTRGWRASICG